MFVYITLFLLFCYVPYYTSAAKVNSSGTFAFLDLRVQGQTDLCQAVRLSERWIITKSGCTQGKQRFEIVKKVDGKEESSERSNFTEGHYGFTEENKNYELLHSALPMSLKNESFDSLTNADKQDFKLIQQAIRDRCAGNYKDQLVNTVLSGVGYAGETNKSICDQEWDNSSMIMGMWSGLPSYGETEDPINKKQVISLDGPSRVTNQSRIGRGSSGRARQRPRGNRGMKSQSSIDNQPGESDKYATTIRPAALGEPAAPEMSDSLNEHPGAENSGMMAGSEGYGTSGGQGVSGSFSVRGVFRSFGGQGAPGSSGGQGVPNSSGGQGVPNSSDGQGVSNSFGGQAVPYSFSGHGVPSSFGGQGVSNNFGGQGFHNSFGGQGVPGPFGGLGVPAPLGIPGLLGIPGSLGIPGMPGNLGIPGILGGYGGYGIPGMPFVEGVMVPSPPPKQETTNEDASRGGWFGSLDGIGITDNLEGGISGSAEIEKLRKAPILAETYSGGRPENEAKGRSLDPFENDDLSDISEFHADTGSAEVDKN